MKGVQLYEARGKAPRVHSYPTNGKAGDTKKARMPPNLSFDPLRYRRSCSFRGYPRAKLPCTTRLRFAGASNLVNKCVRGAPIDKWASKGGPTAASRTVGKPKNTNYAAAYELFAGKKGPPCALIEKPKCSNRSRTASSHPFECGSPPVSFLCQLPSSRLSWPFGLQSPTREASLQPFPRPPRPPLVERPRWTGSPRPPPSPLLPGRPSPPGKVVEV